MWSFRDPEDLAQRETSGAVAENPEPDHILHECPARLAGHLVGEKFQAPKIVPEDGARQDLGRQAHR